MATHMKSWHVVVLDGWKYVKDTVKFDVSEARALEKQYKEDYAESNPSYIVKREWY